VPSRYYDRGLQLGQTSSGGNLHNISNPRLGNSGLSRFGLLLLFRSGGPCILVLTHQAIIDSTWESAIRPLLLKRFGATPEELKQAHALRYGLHYSRIGLLPVRQPTFSDLTTLRPDGDLSSNPEIANSRIFDEYEFALGALSHYAADNNGHPRLSTGRFPLFLPGAGRGKSKAVVCRRSSAHAGRSSRSMSSAAQGRMASAAYKLHRFEVAKPLSIGASRIPWNALKRRS